MYVQDHTSVTDFLDKKVPGTIFGTLEPVPGSKYATVT